MRRGVRVAHLLVDFCLVKYALSTFFAYLQVVTCWLTFVTFETRLWVWELVGTRLFVVTSVSDAGNAFEASEVTQKR